MPEILLPMRWADLDVLNHVNNVVYVDYAMEARSRLAETHLVEPLLVGPSPIRRVTVDFRRPLLLSSTPVLVRSELAEGVETHEIRSHDGSVLYASVVVETGPPDQTIDPTGHALDLQVRHSDVGPDGTITVTKLFELFQEMRILGFSTILPHHGAGRFVVGRVELSVGESLSWRAEPYATSTRISHVSRSSFGSTSSIEGGRFGTATATLIGFDPAAQSSRVLDDDERDALHASMAGV